jgi:hypothetical protein
MKPVIDEKMTPVALNIFIVITFMLLNGLIHLIKIVIEFDPGGTSPLDGFSHPVLLPYLEL